jgi:ABC-type multidrug transport system ATPase subunit
LVGPGDGQVFYDDEPFHRERLDLRRRLHLLPDFPFFFQDHTVLQHLGLVLRVYQKDGAGLEERVLDLLRDFDLLPLTHKRLPTLSRGQAYKAALVTLMAVDPELWLLDEPFASGMDPHGIDAFKVRTREAVRCGRTVIYTTQLLDLAERFADRVCILHEGAVRIFSTLDALRTQASGSTGALEQVFRQLRSERP